jgi:PAS domain S-box-containing protein
LGELSGRHILVVEDEKGQAQIISFLFKHAFDAEVIIASTTAEAREYLRSDEFDLITLDYQLPDADGLNLLEEIQAMPGPPPVIMITGHGDEQTAVSAFKLGASGYVVKDKRMSTMIIEEARSALARARLDRAEAALAESRQELQEVFDSSLVGTLTFDKEGQLQMINRQAMKILGIDSLEDTRGFTLFGRGYLADDVTRSLRKGEPTRATVKYDFDKVAKFGLYKPSRTGIAYVEGTAVPLLDDSTGEVTRFIAQFEDVTERIRNERAIRAQRDLANAVLRTDSLEDALAQVLSTVLEATDLEVGGVYVLDEDTGLLTLACHQGVSDEFAESVRQYERDDPRAALVMGGQAIYTSYEEVPRDPEDTYSEDLKGFAIVPLVAGEDILGCLNLGSRTLSEIPAELRDIIESLAPEAAQAIQRELTSAALRDERDRIKSIIDALPVGMVLLDRNGKLLMQNKIAEGMAKLSSEQQRGRTGDSPEWEPTDWDGNPVPVEQTPFVRALITGKPVLGMRLSGSTGLGERFHVSESAAPVLNSQGEIEAILVTLEDMTDLRDALVSLKQAEKLYRETVESLNEGLWVIDAEAVTTFVSDRMAEMLGYTPEEMMGTSALAFTHDEGKEILKRNLELRRQGITQDYDFEFVRKDGSRMQAYLAAAPITDKDGNYVGAHAGVMDITDRKRIEKELEESNSLYRTQFETSPDAITVTDLSGNVRSASRRTAEMHGYGDPGELVGMSALELIVPEQRELAMDGLFKTLEQGSVRNLDYLMLKKDGTTFHGALNAAILKDAEGNPTGFIATTRDMTQRMEWEQSLRDLNAELEGYAHAVSHDLKGPISALIASTAIISSTVEQLEPGDERTQLEEMTEVVSNSAGRAFDLVSNLLLLAESGQRPQHVEEVSIDAVVDSILVEKADEIAEKGVRIDRDADLGYIAADPTHIYQVFSNLISNGLKHNDSPEPSLRILRLEGESESNHFIVCDNGSGINEDLIERVFEPFFRGEWGGAGLGLSIVKKVVGVYGGTVSAYNDDGACFEVVMQDYEER